MYPLGLAFARVVGTRSFICRKGRTRYESRRRENGPMPERTGGRSGPRIESFDPLLRDLVGWGLVTRVETDGVPSWQLGEAAQDRLNEIIRPAGSLSPEQLVYLDHFCADCQVRGTTRLHDGVYLCSACSERRLVGTPEPPPTVQRWRWRRDRPEPNTDGSAEHLAVD